jgi:hypothetical protein
MTKQQINNAIGYIKRVFDNMTLEEANNYMAGDGFHKIFEDAIDQAFDTSEEAARWWYSSDPTIGREYDEIYNYYLTAHAKMWKRLHPEEYTNKKMKRSTKRAMLKAAKHHFKQYPNGSIEISYAEPIPCSGEIGTFCYNYRTFKFELGFAASQHAVITALTFKY